MTAVKPSTIEDQQEFIVASLPNIDNTRAKKLLSSFQTVEVPAGSSTIRETSGV